MEPVKASEFVFLLDSVIDGEIIVIDTSFSTLFSGTYTHGDSFFDRNNTRPDAGPYYFAFLLFGQQWYYY